MPDFTRGLIYTIRTRESVYVGSTTNFTRRKCQHKSSIYNEKYNQKIYQKIRENNFEWDIKPYKEYPCETKLQLKIEEERIRQLLNADLNSQSCGTGIEFTNKSEYEKQYNIVNQEKISEQQKQYNANNKEKIAKQRKQHYTVNKDRLLDDKKRYRINNKDKIAENNKQYRNDNKKEISENKKQYYNQNKEKISEKQKQKITCECGCILSRCSLTLHRRSKKHLDLMEIINSV